MRSSAFEVRGSAPDATGAVASTVSRVSPGARWTVVDQGISSASNLLFVASVAHSSGVGEFGAFSLAYLVHGLALGSGRAIGGDILLLRAEQQPACLGRDMRRLLGLVLALGVVAGLGACSIATWVGGTFGASLLALGAVLPIVLLQDALRYCLIARRTPSLAAANDLIWLAVQVVATVALLGVVPEAGPGSIVLAWASGAAVALGVGLWQARLTPSLRGASEWFTHDRARVSSFFGDFAMHSGSTYASAYLIAGIGKVEDVAAVRGSILLFAPLDALFMAVRLVTLLALARSVALGNSSLRRQARLVAVFSVGITLAWGAGAVSLPDWIGRAVLGASWEVVTPILVPMALAAAAKYSTLPPQAGLRAMGATRSILSIRVTVTLVMFAGVIVGTYMAGALGAAIGLAIAYGMDAILSWASFAGNRSRLPPGFAAQQPLAESAAE